ncbi:hypothetical protein T06_7947 [Trichinella sp. T6]|nr:hypothetical protein T06_7947 [Trichinella sp. T6]
MSPSNVGNFGIGLVELVLGLLFLVAVGWVISADDGISAAASRWWAWRCMALSLSISSSNSIIAGSPSSSGKLSRYRCCDSKKSCVVRPNVLVALRMASVSVRPAQSPCNRSDLSNISVLILRRRMFWFGSLDWSYFWSSRLWRMFDRWSYHRLDT